MAFKKLIVLERDSKILAVIYGPQKRIMGHHDVSTWIMTTLTTGQDALVQHLQSGPSPDCGQRAEH